MAAGPQLSDTARSPLMENATFDALVDFVADEGCMSGIHTFVDDDGNHWCHSTTCKGAENIHTLAEQARHFSERSEWLLGVL